jgi:enoyl-CoA hydratase/carnithine racemase
MSYEHILYDKAGPVLTITLNRPAALNAISPALEQELTRRWMRPMLIPRPALSF